MYEVEAKVSIYTSAVSVLRKQILTFAKPYKKGRKKDTYYGWEDKIAVKIREGAVLPALILKIRDHKGKIEINRELELKLKSKKSFESLLTKSDFKKTDEKSKIYEYYKFKTFQIEINHIPGLGWYLEIENIIQKKSGIKKATTELNQLFQSLGFSQKDYEKRYYIDMLAEQKK